MGAAANFPAIQLWYSFTKFLALFCCPSDPPPRQENAFMPVCAIARVHKADRLNPVVFQAFSCRAGRRGSLVSNGTRIILEIDPIPMEFGFLASEFILTDACRFLMSSTN
jgi:hypothetical protein